MLRAGAETAAFAPSTEIPGGRHWDLAVVDVPGLALHDAAALQLQRPKFVALLAAKARYYPSNAQKPSSPHAPRSWKDSEWRGKVDGLLPLPLSYAHAMQLLAEAAAAADASERKQMPCLAEVQASSSAGPGRCTRPASVLVVDDNPGTKTIHPSLTSFVLDRLRSRLAFEGTAVDPPPSVNNRVLCQMLQADHHATTSAFDGAQALSATEKASFDLVFMDIQMPIMDGLESARTMRHRGVCCPIVAVSDSVDPCERSTQLFWFLLSSGFSFSNLLQTSAWQLG